MNIIRFPQKDDWKKITERPHIDVSQLNATVSAVLADVKARGDEAVKDNWKLCPKCQRRIRNEHLADEEALQGWLVAQVYDYLKQHGRTLIGWDEVSDDNLGSDAVVMSWRGMQPGQDAALRGNKVIMCPTDYCYLDYYQADPRYQPASIGGHITLAKAYEFDPAPRELNSHVAANIMGGQCNL